MKNLLMILLSLFLAGSSFAMANIDSEESLKELQIKRAGEPGSEIGKIRPREFVPVEGVLYCNSGNIVFTFLANLGEVVITVSDANGNVVATSTCDSAASNTANVVVPIVAGSYTISIVSEHFIGEASYEL